MKFWSINHCIFPDKLIVEIQRNEVAIPEPLVTLLNEPRCFSALFAFLKLAEKLSWKVKGFKMSPDMGKEAETIRIANALRLILFQVV